jgi:DeoR family deoxyribose operon repressor
MNREARLEVINRELKSKKVISIKELAEIMNVSEMTIRRDVAELEKNKIVDVFFGGISLSENGPYYQIEKEAVRMLEEKKRIAKKAVSLIEDLDVILIDTGSTTGLMVDYLSDKMDNIVYCYALNIINGVCSKPNLSVVTCGGYYHKNTSMFESEEGANLLKKAHLNKVFMAARGITKEKGITTAEPYEINIKRAALSVSDDRILLADSTKFGKAWYEKYADLSDFNIIITDDKLDDTYRKIIEDMGITLHIE